VKSDVTVCIPTIPPRHVMLAQAVQSVALQTLPPAAISIAVDTDRRGAWHTRQRAVDAVTTDWIAFLDDDDLFKPQHLQRLRECADETGASYIYSYWDTSVTPDILGLFGQPFDPANPTHTTMTVMVKTWQVLKTGASCSAASTLARASFTYLSKLGSGDTTVETPVAAKTDGNDE
jgi:glycosyltransferase involved in cell wall biosynthesis